MSPGISGMLTITPITSSFAAGKSRRRRRTTPPARPSRETPMAAAKSQAPPPQAKDMAWHDIVQQTLKRNEIRLVTYVPDRVLTTLIRNIHADLYFTAFPTAREEEAVG